LNLAANFEDRPLATASGSVKLMEDTTAEPGCTETVKDATVEPGFIERAEDTTVWGSPWEQRFFCEEAPLTLLLTRPRHEKKFLETLEASEVPCYLPLYTKVVKYKKGRVERRMPLFMNYVFCHGEHLINVHPRVRDAFLISMIRVPPGVEADFIQEMLVVRAMLATRAPMEACDELLEGQKVRVKTGLLKDLEGYVEKKLGITRFVINVHMLGRSVRMEVDPADLKAI